MAAFVSDLIYVAGLAIQTSDDQERAESEVPQSIPGSFEPCGFIS